VTSSGDPRTRREGEIPGAGVLGMWIFLATLSMLFLASIAGYLVVRLKAPAWPPPGMPRLPSGLWLSTGLLLAGSVTVHLALLRVRLGQRTATVRYLLATTGLALAFLLVQTWNWWGLPIPSPRKLNRWRAKFSPRMSSIVRTSAIGCAGSRPRMILRAGSDKLKGLRCARTMKIMLVELRWE